MGRGKSLKTKEKERRFLAKAEAKGRLQGQAEWKKTQTGIWTSLRDHIGNMIDKIDPLEAIAITSTTVLVYEVLSHTEDFLDQIRVLSPFGITFFRLFGFKPVGEEGLGLIPEELEKPMLLATSFFIAFMLIRHPEVIGLLGKSISGLGSMLIGTLT